METILERLAYAIARGVTSAWLDVMRERSTQVDELVSSEDGKRADRMRDAVRRVQPAASVGHTGSVNSASSGEGGNPINPRAAG